jgi:hypothetical protein
MHTPFLPALRPILAPMGSRSKTAARALAQATLLQIEQTLGPALDPELLLKPASGDHCRERVFFLVRTFWCWIWQVLQANTSCRQVVRHMQARAYRRGEHARGPKRGTKFRPRRRQRRGGSPVSGTGGSSPGAAPK